MADRNVWGSVLEKIETHQMPPPKGKATLSNEDRQQLHSWINELVARPDAILGVRDPGRPSLRRLTRLEYNNTVRDLLGISSDLFAMPERLPYGRARLPSDTTKGIGDQLEIRMREYGQKYKVLLPEAGLPGDNRAEHGYRNRGDAANFSPLLLEQYVATGRALAMSDAFAETPLGKELLAKDNNDPGVQRKSAEQRWRRILPLMYRSAITSDDLNETMADYDIAIKNGADFIVAMRSVFALRLASFSFLYHQLPLRSGGSVRRLTAYELANRLSYLIWSSMPDDALFAAAADGSLLTSAGLEKAVSHLLSHPRAIELSDSFAVQWLRLDQLYACIPDRDLYKSFYNGEKGTLHNAMLTEAMLLFDAVRVENRSIIDFIAANYTWLNPTLAKHYDLDQPRVPTVTKKINGKELQSLNKEQKDAYKKQQENEAKINATWVRVPLTNQDRGGYLTMSAPLLVTSLPFRTSPVKRGAWLLETLFNRPPTEPKVAFAVDNATNEAAQLLSIRERFEAHRNKPACFSCHIRLDPPGFALEQFDAIGRWRVKDGNASVDASGTWHNQAFDGPAAYKRLLVKQPDEFVNGFIEHLLSYALGRRLEAFDLPAIDDIRRGAAANGYRFTDIVLGIAKSYPFQQIRNTK